MIEGINFINGVSIKKVKILPKKLKKCKLCVNPVRTNRATYCPDCSIDVNINTKKRWFQSAKGIICKRKSRIKYRHSLLGHEAQKRHYRKYREHIREYYRQYRIKNLL
jgi:hypothetical protein